MLPSSLHYLYLYCSNAGPRDICGKAPRRVTATLPSYGISNKERFDRNEGGLSQLGDASSSFLPRMAPRASRLSPRQQPCETTRCLESSLCSSNSRTGNTGSVQSCSLCGSDSGIGGPEVCEPPLQ
ncbi:hypothetical protein P691DRAFT_67667 [Macrolepiota fuliginosa MF-IS2]|uniref:Uncharacterized protein n=1 Tax=Macrolepiota fuliginosa MF-IS2 TaxID=1400762 RepID=A0A9P5XD73_9AGAR|nr:hypothetical protein P691DRAFT_67667 [Macrolepiota fuliginosa MF-IS2]